MRGATRAGLLAAWLLAGNLFWVLAYDTEYAMVDRDDDLKIGMKTSAHHLRPLRRGGRDGRATRSSWWSGPGPARAVALGVLFYVGMAVAAAQALWHWRLIRDRTREGCFKAFRLNHWLGFTVFAGVVAGYAVR